MYIPIEYSPNDQIRPKLFVSINSTDIYISSCKFAMNVDVISILNILKEFWAITRYRAPPRHVIEKVAMSGNQPVFDNVILASTLILNAISLLREYPLSPGILDFEIIVSCVSSSKREFIYLTGFRLWCC
jgi:hypothetical protein